MHSQNSWPEQRRDASRSRTLLDFLARLIFRRAPSARTMARTRKFVGYYRPYVPLLVADLACALLVAATIWLNRSLRPVPDFR